MTDNRPNKPTPERDLQNIARSLRDSANAGPEARDPDALRDYARRIDKWAVAYLNRRLALYRDTWNEGAGGGGEGNGYSYRPDPTKETRVYVPRFLCGTKRAAPPTIVIEGLPPFDAAGARPRLNRSLPPGAEADARPRLNRRVR